MQCRMFDFEQLDAVLDRHVEDFLGLEIGQLAAGVLNRRQLLLLLHFDGHIAEGDDQMPRTVVGIVIGAA